MVFGYLNFFSSKKDRKNKSFQVGFFLLLLIITHYLATATLFVKGSFWTQQLLIYVFIRFHSMSDADAKSVILIWIVALLKTLFLKKEKDFAQ